MTITNISTVNVTNGVATIQLDTTDIAEGEYTITTKYNQNDNYKESTTQSTLTINNPQPCTMTIEGTLFELPAHYFTTTGTATIDYGDNTSEEYTGQAISHTYNQNDTYTITITGIITAVSPNTLSDTMKTNLKQITIPSSVTSLGNSCFRDCTGLTSITIPSSVTSLGTYCFYGCTGLTSITIPSSVTSIRHNCFYNCTSLTSITIPSGVTSLGTYCFRGCTGLTSITIPSSVTSLGSGCFRDCTGLTSITIPSGVTSLGTDCFYGCSNLVSVEFSWTSSDTILTYNTGWNIRTAASIIIPQNTTALYTDKEYPSNQLTEQT